ncbi:MAG: hypothetical protein AABN33_18375 [Acidobacteriota bacterium]
MTLYAKNTTANGIIDSGDAIVYDMTIAEGASIDTAVTNTVASGTQIQLTKTAGGLTVAWISGRFPAVGGGWGGTLTGLSLAIKALESNMSANVGLRVRIFRYQPGTVTELGGGPFDDGIELGTTAAEMNFVANVTDQVFSENDRLLLRTYLTNIGTMGGGFTATVNFNHVNERTSFVLNETVAFKAEAAPNFIPRRGSFGQDGRLRR